MHVLTKRGVARLAVIAVVSMACLLLILLYLWDSGSPPAVTVNPECPHHGGELALPAGITNVPEYHDCQRLIEPDGLKYGALAGIYARFGLDRLVIQTVENPAVLPPDSAAVPSDLVVPVGGPVRIPGVRLTSVAALVALDRELRAKARAVGEINSYDLPYSPLAIIKGLNCLFVVRVVSAPGAAYSYRAIMFNVPDDNVCKGSAPLTGGTWLKATYLPPESGKPPFLPVARWDWDTDHNKQFIGILCQPDWCEISDDQTVASRPRDVTVASPAAEAAWEQKGRYDEQRLAVMGTTGLEPSAVLATASPHEKLGTYREEDFRSTWLHVANTVLPSPLQIYEAKLNFHQGSIPGLSNQVYLCSGGRFRCLGFFAGLATLPMRCWKSDGRNWWSKIVSSDGSVRYRCVTRRTQDGVDPPAAVRWRWKMNDETLWERCGTGCCEVEGGS
jgi:hypothetical protein